MHTISTLKKRTRLPLIVLNLLFKPNSMQIKKHIPNLLTLLNLFSGCIALAFVFAAGFFSKDNLHHEYFEWAMFFVGLGIFFDFFDGFFARMFHVSGPLGVQLDSLADMVTSGVVPGATMFFLFFRANNLGIEDISLYNTKFLACFLGFIITLGSCFRLAKFNIDTRQTDSFIGLPTPANALFILSLPLVRDSESLIAFELLINPYVLMFITLLSAYVMNAEIPLFSLKIKKFSLRENGLQLAFLLVSLILILLFKFTGIPLVIIFYVLLSMARNMAHKKQ